MEREAVNPIFHWLIEHTVRRALARECPKCKHSQTVPKSRERETVSCTRCGGAIPPKARPR